MFDMLSPTEILNLQIIIALLALGMCSLSVLYFVALQKAKAMLFGRRFAGMRPEAVRPVQLTAEMTKTLAMCIVRYRANATMNLSLGIVLAIYTAALGSRMSVIMYYEICGVILLIGVLRIIYWSRRNVLAERLLQQNPTAP